MPAMRAAYVALTCAAPLAGCSGHDAVTMPEARYNVVVIVSDALRQDIVGCYGGPARTPNIDLLASSGVLFENAYSTSPWTSPSSVSMFTGNYATSYEYTRKGLSKPHPSMAHDEEVDIPRIFVPDSEFTLIEALQQAGYNTAMEFENVNASLHNNIQGATEREWETEHRVIADSINTLTRGAMSRSWDTPGYHHAFSVLRHLLELDAGENFFTAYWMLDPHSPYDPPAVFSSKIAVDESRLTVPRDWYSKKRYSRDALTPAENQFVWDLYRAEVESVDERVGFVMSMLMHKDLVANTIIVFTSDHGEEFGEHGLFEHGGHGLGCHYYETLMRVPLIIVGPGIPAGLRVDDPVTLLGLMPTLKDMLGVKYDDTMQGESYLPLIAGKASNEPLYFDDVQEHDQLDALLDGKYKLIVHHDGQYELYALDIDPAERVNLARGMTDRVETMYADIVAWRERNLERRRENLAALGDNIPEMSDQERAILLKKLRALGYVR